MNTANAYETLYMNMKNRFTVVENGCECTLGEAMLMKAGKKRETSNLPAQRSYNSSDNAISTLFKYVNDKLTLKAPPAKDKIIKRFPLRTSLAAVLSAVVACTLVISYGSTTFRSNLSPSTVEVGESYEENIEDYSTYEK